MRRWLFGSILSSEVISDFDFLRLIFASCGSPNFDIIYGRIGYTWCPDTEVQSELIAMGIDVSKYSLSWLEYQARSVSGK